MMQLDETGIICAVGSACSASNEEPSHVLQAIGLTDDEAQSSLRFSMGRQTTAKDIKTAVLTLQKIIHQ
jgi:cysteine desulfurase